MNRIVPLIGLALLMASPVMAQDQPVFIHQGFVTGQDFHSYGAAQQRQYVMGVVDGMFLAPLYGAPRPRMEWLGKCVTGMSDEQVQVISARYLDEHPERWTQYMHLIVFSALKETCDR